MSAEKIAAVLAEHQDVICHAPGEFLCLCGAPTDGTIGAHVAHQAAMLEPVIREAKAAALEDAAESLDLPGCTATGYYASECDSGYREAETHAEQWLRARAAGIREGKQ